MADQQNEFLDPYTPPLPLKQLPSHLNFYEVQMLDPEDPLPQAEAKYQHPDQICIRQGSSPKPCSTPLKNHEAQSTWCQPTVNKKQAVQKQPYQNPNAFDSVSDDDGLLTDYASATKQELTRDILRMKEQMNEMIQTINKLLTSNQQALFSPGKYRVGYIYESLVKEKVNSDRWLACSRRDLKALELMEVAMSQKPEIYHLEEQIKKGEHKRVLMGKDIECLQREIQELCNQEEQLDDGARLYRDFRKAKYQHYQQQNKEKLLVQQQKRLNEKLFELIRKKKQNDSKFETLQKAVKGHMLYGLSAKQKESHKALLAEREGLRRRVECIKRTYEQRFSKLQRETQETRTVLKRLQAQLERATSYSKSIEWRIDVCLEEQQLPVCEPTKEALEHATPGRKSSRLAIPISDIVSNYRNNKLPQKMFANSIGSVQFETNSIVFTEGGSGREQHPKDISRNSFVQSEHQYAQPIGFQLKRPNPYMKVHPSKRIAETHSEVSRRTARHSRIATLKELSRQSESKANVRSKRTTEKWAVQEDESPQKQRHQSISGQNKYDQSKPSESQLAMSENPQNLKRRVRKSKIIHTLENDFVSYAGEQVLITDQLSEQRHTRTFLPSIANKSLQQIDIHIETTRNKRASEAHFAG